MLLLFIIIKKIEVERSDGLKLAAVKVKKKKNEKNYYY